MAGLTIFISSFPNFQFPEITFRKTPILLNPVETESSSGKPGQARLSQKIIVTFSLHAAGGVPGTNIILRLALLCPVLLTAEVVVMIRPRSGVNTYKNEE